MTAIVLSCMSLTFALSFAAIAIQLGRIADALARLGEKERG